MDSAFEELIDCYWYWRSPSTAAPVPHATPPESSRQKILPDGCIDIILTFDPDQRLETARVAGAMTRPTLVAGKSDRRYYSIRFRPGGASAFLGCRARDLTDRIVELERFPHLQNFLGRFKCEDDAPLRAFTEMQPTAAADPRVLFALSQIRRDVARASVQSAADLLGISRQHLGRLFELQVGLSPKRLIRIERMRQARAALLKPEPAESSASTALRFGYFDQAHMIQDFRELTGTSPGQLRPG